MITFKPKEELHVAQVSSVEEMQAALPDISSNGVATHYVSLSVNMPEISVCPFALEDVQPKEIKNRLVAEAVESLSMPADLIELDYKIFESTEENQVRGVYVCYPKQIVRDFLQGIDRSGYIPIKIVPSILAGIDSFLDQYKDNKGRFCLFDFSGEGIIYFAVFSNGHCDYLREIVYEGDDEVEHEVIQSLRSACAMSHIKKFDQIYFSGNVPNKDHIFKKVKSLFCDNVTHGYFTNVEASLRRKDNMIALNLIKSNTLTVKERALCRNIVLGFLGGCLLVIAALGIMIMINNGKIKNLDAQNSESDYNYAQDLQNRLKEIK